MKNAKLPSLISVLVLTLLTSVMWISFSVYRALTATPAPVVPAEVSQPLTPTLDQDSLKLVESKIFLNDSEVPDNIVTGAISAPTAQPTVVPAPTATPEASPSATPL